MNIVNKLTIRHLRLNRGRTLVTILGIAVSVAMVCAVAGFVLSLRDVLRRTIIDSRGDYHVAYLNISPETADQIADESVFGTYYIQEVEGTVSIYLRLINPGNDLWEVASNVAEKYHVDQYTTNDTLLGLEGVIAPNDTYLAFQLIAVIAIAVIVTGSVIVIANAFYISSSERVRQFGLLKSAGATKQQIGRSILFEAFLLAAIALPLGILLGFLIQAAALTLVNNLLKYVSSLMNNTLNFHVIVSPLVVFISIAIAAVTVLVSAWLPARRAAKTSPIDAIHQTKDIKIRSKQLNTSRLVQRFFGFEGTLAAKSLKRSRGKYRSAVISLTASVVLFVSMSSLVWILNKDAQMTYGGYDFDVLMYVYGSAEELDEADALLSPIPDAEITSSRFMNASTAVNGDFFSEREQAEHLELYGEERSGRAPLRFISMPDSEFAKLAPLAAGANPGILINTTVSSRDGGKIVEYAPYNFKSGAELPVFPEWGEESTEAFETITLAAQIEDSQGLIPSSLFYGYWIHIIIPETVFYKLSATYEGLEPYAQYYVTSVDPDKFCEIAGQLLSEVGSVQINNVAQDARANRSIVLAVMLFGYGFIAMLSLIAVSSVITTISTGMALRKQEFAMLYSVGMTSKGMNKMLNLESLLYGLKSLAIGLPIGAVLSYLFYKSMSGMREFAYQLPVTSMVISAIAVLLLTFGTMRYSKRRLQKVSIVDAIRGETT